MERKIRFCLQIPFFAHAYSTEANGGTRTQTQNKTVIND